MDILNYEIMAFLRGFMNNNKKIQTEIISEIPIFHNHQMIYISARSLRIQRTISVDEYVGAYAIVRV